MARNNSDRTLTFRGADARDWSLAPGENRGGMMIDGDHPVIAAWMEDGDLVVSDEEVVRASDEEEEAGPEGEAEAPSPDGDPETLSVEEAARRSAILIPDGWRDQHHATIIALAKSITGTGEPTTEAEAIVVIEAEIARRESAA